MGRGQASAAGVCEHRAYWWRIVGEGRNGGRGLAAWIPPAGRGAWAGGGHFLLFWVPKHSAKPHRRNSGQVRDGRGAPRAAVAAAALCSGAAPRARGAWRPLWRFSFGYRISWTRARRAAPGGGGRRAAGAGRTRGKPPKRRGPRQRGPLAAWCRGAPPRGVPRRAARSKVRRLGVPKACAPSGQIVRGAPRAGETRKRNPSAARGEEAGPFSCCGGAGRCCGRFPARRPRGPRRWVRGGSSKLYDARHVAGRLIQCSLPQCWIDKPGGMRSAGHRCPHEGVGALRRPPLFISESGACTPLLL